MAFYARGILSVLHTECTASARPAVLLSLLAMVKKYAGAPQPGAAAAMTSPARLASSLAHRRAHRPLPLGGALNNVYVLDHRKRACPAMLALLSLA